MIPEIIGVLTSAGEYVTINSICRQLEANLGPEIPQTSNLELEVANHLDEAHRFGLVTASGDGQFKVAFQLGSTDDPRLRNKMNVLKQELQTRRADREAALEEEDEAGEEPVAGPSHAVDAAGSPGDCGPGWRRRPVAQRQAIAIYRRMQAERKAQGRGRKTSRTPTRRGRSRSRGRSSSRTRRRSRGGRSRSGQRSRSRTRR